LDDGYFQTGLGLGLDELMGQDGEPLAVHINDWDESPLQPVTADFSANIEEKV
jgi:hypothetical protein